MGAWESVDACHYALAEVLKSLKKYGEEALVWQDLAKRENSNFRSEAMLNGAEAWIAAQNSNKALLLLQNYAKDFPRGSEIFFVKKRIAEVLIEAGRYADASTFIMELLKGEKLVVKESQRLRAVLGQVYYLQKNYSAAVKSLLLVWQTTDLQEDLRLEVGVYLGYSNISLKKEADAAKILAVIALMSNGLSKMLEEAEELDVARLLERFHYLQAADAIYTRVSKSKALKNKLQSLLGLGRTAMERQKHAVALKLLGKVLDLCAKANLAERVSALSLQGEIYSILNKNDQAYQTFEFALRLKGGDQRSMCRILYGMAQLLKQREDYTESRRYANRVFIMYKDPLYAPKALFLSVQLLHIKGKLKEEKQILRELKQNFPLYFAKIEVQDYLKEHGIKSD
ncbi:MAG: hypothetical protein HRT88_14405 [Lentisphaeraceae bacterium]|nr:hypothetical protein [Lentisphaeraceae bacterium]